MKAEWFANVNGQEYGPYTWQQMLQMAAEGRVPADLPVKRTGDKKWFTARQVPGLVTPAPAAAKAAGPTSSRPAKDDSQLKRAKPIAPSAAADAVPVPPAPPPSPPPPPPSPPPPRAPAQAANDSPWPVIVSDVPKGKGAVTAAPSGQPADHVPPPKSSPLIIVGILASVAAVVLLAGGIGVWAVWYRPRPAASSAQVANASAPEANVGEGGAPALARTAATSADDEGAAPSSDGPTKAELAAQEKTVKSISSWHSVAGVRSFGFPNVSLQVARVWRTDAAGEEEKKTAGPLVCVEVTIRNKSRSPLVYKGWNSFGDNGAILADENDQLLPLVPVEKTPDLTRLTRTIVPGGGSVTDLLVFAAPAREEEVLHLVLPYSVFYSNVRPPHRALELTPDMMGVDLAAGSQAAAAEPSDAPEADSAPVASADEAKAKEPSKPKSLRDMINSEPGPPARPDDMPEEKNDKGDQSEKPKGEKTKEEKPAKPKDPENPFEPKGANPLDPLSVVPKDEE